jgi:molybdopterin converting factor small subunit
MSPAELPVRVLLFGRYRELAGTGEIRLEVPPGSRVRDVVGLLRARPALQALPADPAVAVNRRYEGPDRALAAGDEVALIPPVAGG